MKALLNVVLEIRHGGDVDTLHTATDWEAVTCGSSLKSAEKLLDLHSDLFPRASLERSSLPHCKSNSNIQ